ncbi:hypothetical protein ABT346_04000 [Micromonospora peucetia]|uniref:hypothetical protein n=1 Tax=Micromonospora peucetia TaxID=47871 RepID=UPI003317FD87
MAELWQKYPSTSFTQSSRAMPGKGRTAPAEALLKMVEWVMSRPGDAVPATVELVVAQDGAGLSDRQLAELWQKYPSTSFTQSSRETPDTELSTDQGSGPASVASEGNDLFDALIGTFPEHLSSRFAGQVPTVEQVRERVAAELEADFARATELEADLATAVALEERLALAAEQKADHAHTAALEADRALAAFLAADRALAVALEADPAHTAELEASRAHVTGLRADARTAELKADLARADVLEADLTLATVTGEVDAKREMAAKWAGSVAMRDGESMEQARRRYVEDLRTPGSWQHDADDLVSSIAAEALKLPATLLLTPISQGSTAVASVGIAAGRYLPAAGDRADPALNGGSLPVYQSKSSGIDWFTVVAHGEAGGVRVGDRVLDAAGFAGWLRSVPGWAGRPLALVVCGAAKADANGRSFAQEVRDLLGVRLLAAPENVYTSGSGGVFAGTFDMAAGLPRFTSAGEAAWQLFPAERDAESESLGSGSLDMALHQVGAKVRAEEELTQRVVPGEPTWISRAGGLRSGRESPDSFESSDSSASFYSFDSSESFYSFDSSESFDSFEMTVQVEGPSNMGASVSEQPSSLAAGATSATSDTPRTSATSDTPRTSGAPGVVPVLNAPGVVSDSDASPPVGVSGTARGVSVPGTARVGLVSKASEVVPGSDVSEVVPVLDASEVGSDPVASAALSTPSDAELLDAAYVVAMQPVLEMRLQELTSPNTPESQETTDALEEINLLITKAQQAGELPSAPLARTMVNASPAQMRAWQETAMRNATMLAQRVAATPEERARNLLGVVLYQDFPMRTGALGLDPEALGNAQFLPVVQQVLDPSATMVTEQHMRRLTGYVTFLAGRGEPVTLDALTRRAGFDALKDRLSARTDVSPSVVDAVWELDRQVMETIQGRRGGLPLSPDRVLELRGLAQDLLIERNESFDPTSQNLETLNQVIDSAYRRYGKEYDGARPDGPLRLSHLEHLLHHKFGDQATLTWANMQRVADLSNARQRWRDSHPGQAWVAGVTRTVIRKLPAVGRSHVYQTVNSRHTRNIQKAPGQADSPAERQRESASLWTAVSLADPGAAAPLAPQQLDPVTQADLAELVDVRRRLYADPRDRRYTGLSDYQPMALELLGVEGAVGVNEVRELAALVRTVSLPSSKFGKAAAAAVRFHRSVARRKLAEAATLRWQDPVDRKPGIRPNPAEVTEDHSRLVTAFHAIGELPFAPELTAWLNRAVPFGGGQITEQVVKRTLTSLFGQVLDDGAAFSATAVGRTYDIRLWAVPTGGPVVDRDSLLGTVEESRSLFSGQADGDGPLDTKEEEGGRFPGKQENRIYRYRDTATWQSQTEGRSLDVGVAYRGGFGAPGTVQAGRGDLAATYGRQQSSGRRQLAANASSDFQQLRIKEPLGWVNLPVNWVLRVQDRATGRWRELSLRDEHGALRAHQVRYAVAEFQLPYSLEDRKLLEQHELRSESQPSELESGTDDYLAPVPVTSPAQFPVWSLDHAVPRVQLADAVLDGVRQALTPEDYAFWKPIVEAYLSNDQLALGLRDILRPGRDRHYQQVFRQTLQRDGRQLSLSLTAGHPDQPISTVTKISEVSLSKETRFDRVLAIVIKTLLSQDATRADRATLTGSLRALEQYLRIGGRGQFTQRRGEQLIRHHRAMLTRAMRVGGELQVVLADFTVQLDVHHRNGSVVTAPEPVSIDGFAHLMVHKNALLSLTGEQPAGSPELTGRAESSTAASTPSEPAPKWWTPGPSFGLTMDFVKSLGGVQELYNQIARLMVDEGYLPKQAAEGRETPWDVLQGLSVTGADVNRPGQAYLNWRLLISQLSEESLRARADDVLNADAGQPGVTWVFPHPADPVSQTRGLTVGLWAEATGTDTYQRATEYQVQYGHTSVDTMTVKGASSRIGDISWYAGVGGTVDDTRLWQLQGGTQHTRSTTEKLGRTQSTALTSDTDGQKMPSSEFKVDIRWHWFANRNQAPVGQPGTVSAEAVLLQPNVLHAGASQPPLPQLDVVAQSGPSLPPISTRLDPPDGLLENWQMRSALTTMTAAIYTTIGVRGVGVLQKELIRNLTNLPATAVWQGLTPIVYKAALLRALSASATIPIGDQVVDLAVRPVGRPEIVKVWLPYTQQVLESQVGHDRGNDGLSQHGAQVQETAGVTALDPDNTGILTGSGAITRSTGQGTSDAALHTVGSYRGVYQDARMAIVRTVVVNRVETADGAVVETFGEALLNVLLTDVLANWRSFDNTELLAEFVTDSNETPAPTAPTVRSLSTKLMPPVSLQDGVSWAVMWPMLFNGGGTETGLGKLAETLAKEAARFGEPELVTQVRSLPSWLSPYLAKMRDGGAAWTFRAGGRAFEVLMSADLIGPARGSRPGGNGVKVYERGNTYQDATRRNVASTSVAGGIAGGTRPGDLAGHWLLTANGARTERVEQADTRGSNLLFMAGLRANKLTDFTQAVRFTTTIREITDLRTRIMDETVGRLMKTVPVRSLTFTVDEDHVVSVPTEGTVPRGEPQPGNMTRLGNALPPTYLVEGILGLRAIHEAVKSTRLGSVLDPAAVPPSADQLTFETMRGKLAEMLTGQGAWFRSVATAAEVVDPGPDGFRVRATLGEIRQLYYMEKAEQENYDHGTDLVAHSQNENKRTNATGTFTLGIEVAPRQSVGPQVAVGTERSMAVGADQTAWIEHRAWLRMDTSVFFVYALLEYEIRLPGTGLAPLKLAGSVELVVDQKNATKMGIPIEALRAVVPPGKRAKEFSGVTGSGSSAQPGPSSPSSPPKLAATPDQLASFRDVFIPGGSEGSSGEGRPEFVVNDPREERSTDRKGKGRATFDQLETIDEESPIWFEDSNGAGPSRPVEKVVRKQT